MSIRHCIFPIVSQTSRRRADYNLDLLDWPPPLGITFGNNLDYGINLPHVQRQQIESLNDIKLWPDEARAYPVQLNPGMLYLSISFSRHHSGMGSVPMMCPSGIHAKMLLS